MMKKNLKMILAAALVAITGAAQAQWQLTGNAGIDTVNNFVGTTDNRALKFRTNNSVRMTIRNNGNVGIGVITPTVPLHVKSTNAHIFKIDGGTGTYMSIDESGVYRGYLGSYSGNNEDVDFGTGGGNATGKLHLTVQAIPKLTIDATGKIGLNTTNPSPYSKVEIVGEAGLSTICFTPIGGGAQSWIHHGQNGDWYIRSAQNTGRIIMQDWGGQVCIGTDVPATGYLVSINGKAICEELKIRLHADWPDFVFDKNYQPMTIDSLENFIQTNKHLPGIPSAAQVNQDGGIEVGEMQRLLLQKIEELTLLTIKQQKQIDALISQQAKFNGSH